MLGRLDEAVAEWETLLGVYGSHAVARYELGLVYEAMGNLDDARSQYEAFLTAWSRADEALPQVTDARQRLAALSQ